VSEHALSNFNVLVTGGGSGIGLACAEAFVKDGANVTLMGRRMDRLESAKLSMADRYGADSIELAQGDVANEADVVRAIEIASRNQHLDIVVASAGRGALAPFASTDSQDWNDVMATNLNGTFFTFKHAARHMKTGGAMCAISSIAGVRTHRLMSTYCVSKAAIDMLVRNLADELGEQGIRVNSVCPGLVETELASALLGTPPVLEDYLNCMPIRRHGSVEDIAQAVRFLCGPESSWITGVVLSVDGGHHLRRGPDLTPFMAPA
jgi:NAD(P)-dependent dehydrogenase (short-subunit alcohol dehydrogenase family)